MFDTGVSRVIKELESIILRQRQVNILAVNTCVSNRYTGAVKYLIDMERNVHNPIVDESIELIALVSINIKKSQSMIY